MEKEYVVFVGTYTHCMGHVKDGKGRGIEVLSLDTATASLTPLRVFEAGINPTYLVVHPSQRSLYVVNENNGLIGATGQMTGEVLAFSLNKDKLKLLNRQFTHGSDPCHLDIDPSGKFLTCANYSDGSFGVFPLNEQDGSVGKASAVIRHEGSSENPDRQEGPHPHCTVFNGKDGHFYVNDLGIDKTFQYGLQSDGTVSQLSSVSGGPGQGPRHMVFNSNGTFCYVINELKNSVAVYSVNASNGNFTKEVQRISTLPSDFTGDNYPADVHLSKDERYLYGSNRGHNSIVIYRVDETSGELSLVGYESTQGDFPRNFAIDPSGKVMLVANQNSHNIVTYFINTETGKLTPKQNFYLASPVCVQVVDVNDAVGYARSKL